MAVGQVASCDTGNNSTYCCSGESCFVENHQCDPHFGSTISLEQSPSPMTTIGIKQVSGQVFISTGSSTNSPPTTSSAARTTSSSNSISTDSTTAHESSSTRISEAITQVPATTAAGAVTTSTSSSAPSPQGHKHSETVSIAVGSSCGAVALIISLLGALVWLRKHRNKHGHSSTHDLASNPRIMANDTPMNYRSQELEWTPRHELPQDTMTEQRHELAGTKPDRFA